MLDLLGNHQIHFCLRSRLPFERCAKDCVLYQNIKYNSSGHSHLIYIKQLFLHGLGIWDQMENTWTKDLR